MNRVTSLLFIVIGISGCSSLEIQAITPDTPGWVETTKNCDGSDIGGPVQYAVYFGKMSRGGDTEYPTSDTCSEAPEDGVYTDIRALSEGQDLCEVLPVGDWHIAMTAETAKGKSNYSNELKIRVAAREDGLGSTCQIL